MQVGRGIGMVIRAVTKTPAGGARHFYKALQSLRFFVKETQEAVFCFAV